MREIFLSGSAYKRGFEHGETLRSEIVRGLSAWKLSISDQDLGSDDKLAAFLAGTQFIHTLENDAPLFLDELRGISDGAAIPLNEIIAYNLLDEFWGWEVRRKQSAKDAPGACSAVASIVNGKILIAQNLDLTTSFSDNIAILHIEENDALEAILVTSPGALGYCGVNSAGVALCCNALPSANFADRGVPVLAVIRKILSCVSLEEVRNTLNTIEHASAQNYLVADATGAANIECGPGQVEIAQCDENAIWHTNHPRHGLQTRIPVKAGEVGSSNERGAFLADQLSRGKPGNLEAVILLLSDRTVPVCRVGREPTDSHTWATIAVEIGSTIKCLVAAGPPDRTVFQEVKFVNDRLERG